MIAATIKNVFCLNHSERTVVIIDIKAEHFHNLQGSNVSMQDIESLRCYPISSIELVRVGGEEYIGLCLSRVDGFIDEEQLVGKDVLLRVSSTG